MTKTMMEAKMNRLGQAIVSRYMNVMLDQDIVKQAALPPGGKIIAANHPSTTDPLYILSLVKEPMYMLITELAFKEPLIGQYLRAAGHIPVMHDNGRAAFERASELLKQGKTVGIFPEGALSPREGGLHKPRTGAVRLALTANVPLVPVGIALEQERLRDVKMTFDDVSETARLYLRGSYAMTIGEPLELDGSIDEWTYVRQASAKLANRIGMLAYESACRLQKKSVAVDMDIFPHPVV